MAEVDDLSTQTQLAKTSLGLLLKYLEGGKSNHAKCKIISQKAIGALAGICLHPTKLKCRESVRFQLELCAAVVSSEHASEWKWELSEKDLSDPTLKGSVKALLEELDQAEAEASDIKSSGGGFKNPFEGISVPKMGNLRVPKNFLQSGKVAPDGSAEESSEKGMSPQRASKRAPPASSKVQDTAPSAPVMTTDNSELMQPPMIPSDVMSVFDSEKRAKQVYAEAWAIASSRAGVGSEEKVEWKQLRCLPAEAGKGYSWTAVIATDQRILNLEGENAESFDCFGKCVQCCRLSFTLRTAVKTYRWTEILDVKYTTKLGPGKVCCATCCPKFFGIRDAYKDCCHDCTTGLCIGCCPCIYKHRDGFWSGYGYCKCVKICCPDFVDTAKVELAINSEGNSFNPFYDLQRAMRKSYMIERLEMSEAEARALLQVVNNQIVKHAHLTAKK